MKHKISATVICKYSGIPLAISTLWPKLRLESKDVMIGQPFSVIASHAKAWKHYNISQKRVIIASLMYSTDLVSFKNPICPDDAMCDVLVPRMLKVIGELVEISKEKRSKFPSLVITHANKNLSELVSWLNALAASVRDYKTKNSSQIRIDDIARAMVYNREFEKNFNITTVTPRSFTVCYPSISELLTEHQTTIFHKLTSFVGLTLKQVTKELNSNRISVEALKTIRDIVYDGVPERNARDIPHKILCIRWMDYILDDYNSLLAELNGAAVMSTAQLVGGVVIKQTSVIETDKPKISDYKGDFKSYMAALADWKLENEK